jgi:hypothetical protein
MLGLQECVSAWLIQGDGTTWESFVPLVIAFCRTWRFLSQAALNVGHWGLALTNLRLDLYCNLGDPLKLSPEPGLMQGRTFDCATATSGPSYSGSACICGAGFGDAIETACVL